MNKPCAHTSAEPVTTMDGRTVAALCTDCDTQLSAEWLTCEHPAPIDITTLMDRPGSRYICNGCGNAFGRPADPSVIEVWT